MLLFLVLVNCFFLGIFLRWILFYFFGFVLLFYSFYKDVVFFYDLLSYFLIYGVNILLVFYLMKEMILNKFKMFF